MLSRESQSLCASQPEANYCESFGGDRVHLANLKMFVGSAKAYWTTSKPKRVPGIRRVVSRKPVSLSFQT